MTKYRDRAAEARGPVGLDGDPGASVEQTRLVHELQLHQIELEMQNNDLRQTRADLEQALASYTELYDFAPVGYLTLSTTGMIAKINLTGASLLGVDRSNLLLPRFTAFIAKQDQDNWYRYFMGVKQSQERSHLELEMQRGDGTVFYAQLDCVRHRYHVIDRQEPVLDEGEPLVVRVTLTDISARRKVEAEREQLALALKEKNLELECARRAADKANHAKSDFLSSMSHELRTPLSAILGFAQLIQSGTPAPSASQQRSTDQILKAGWYLLDLINEILDLALIESGKLLLSLVPVSLGKVLSECQDMVEPQARQHTISMVFPTFESDYVVRADGMRLKQAMINLLSNAIKYNRPGGSVSVSCAATTPGHLLISVEDTGEGLPADKLAQLFQPFNRLGQESGVKEGTGIGLAVCKQLVELMGGVLGVASTPGKGSVFWIELRLADDPPTGEQVTIPFASLAPQPDPPRQRTLLYVEDQAANRMLVEMLMERRPDIRLLCAKDGASGIQMAHDARPDIILMDINLPDISGTQALRILAQDPSTAHIPVIALSANAMPRDIQHGLKAGFLNYLTKPIKLKEFMETVDLTLQFAQTEAARRAKLAD